MDDGLLGRIFDGRYKMLEVLGTGGMGAVYKALEISLNRNVAIKVLHSLHLSDELSRSRFEREGAILSTLSHVHIMMFYRFGVAPNQSPYIVTEFLSGNTLRVLLDAETAPGWQRIIAIFEQICEALEYSHRLGVVHRDLKPENVIVLSQPEPDFVKIIDFGLATVVPQQSEAEPQQQKLTRTGKVLGTVNYLSPEQCVGTKPDQRSDIYALGCILYESLLGEPPFVADTAMGIMYKHANEKPRSFSGFPEGAKIPTCFDAITQKCLAKDPRNRYQSMDELHRDLQRNVEFLKSVETQSIRIERPAIQAIRGVRSGYVTIIVIALLCIGALLFLWRKDSLFRHSQNYISTKKGHNVEASFSRRSLATRLGYDDLHSVKYILERADAYAREGKYIEAEPLYKHVLAINEKSLGPNCPEVADILIRLANDYARQGKHKEAEPLFSRALTIREKVLGPDDEEVANCLCDLAYNYDSQGMFKEAEALLKRSLAISEKSHGPEHPFVAQNLIELALNYESQDMVKEAEPLLRRSLAINEKEYGPEHHAVALSLNELGSNLKSQGRYKEAESLLNRSLDFSERQFGTDDLGVAQTMFLLADNYRSQKNFEEAAKFYKRSLALKEKIFGPVHPNVAYTLAALASDYQCQRKYAEAEPLYQRALAIWEQTPSPIYTDVVNCMDQLASNFRALGNLSEAEKLEARAKAKRFERKIPRQRSS